MQENQDRYPRLTENQVEVWLNDPCTKYHLECLGFQHKDIESYLAAGAFRDPDNNVTCHNLDFANGQKNALLVAKDPVKLFHHYEMMEVKKDEAA